MSRSIACDRCAKTIRLDYSGKPDDWKKVYAHDLCPECVDLLEEFFCGRQIIAIKACECELTESNRGNHLCKTCWRCIALEKIKRKPLAIQKTGALKNADDNRWIEYGRLDE